MINLRVDDLEWLLAELRKEGIEQVGEMQVYDYGKFAHIVDPEGTKIELWEPVDEKL
ncbi:MAG: bleomycin resistance protein [Chitinophagales bacterium]|jgi:predicted enzyme related to lactoylglutathione lyase|nr:bleomycin resistance protein [Chitinophagales bacterium]